MQRYYSRGDLFARLFSNQQIVNVALAEIGQSNGEKYWNWHGAIEMVETEGYGVYMIEKEINIMKLKRLIIFMQIQFLSGMMCLLCVLVRGY